MGPLSSGMVGYETGRTGGHLKDRIKWKPNKVLIAFSGVLRDVGAISVMMRRLGFLCAAMLAAVTIVSGYGRPETDSRGDWPSWRGPNRNGHADPSQKLPAALDPEKHTLWEAPIPGRGHGSPIVVGEHIYLVTADEGKQTQSLLAYDRRTGNRAWTTVIHSGNFPERINRKATHANNSPVHDGEKLYVTFVNDGAACATALNLKGEKIWTTRLTDYTVHQGYGASPMIYRSLLLVCADNKKAGAILGLDRETGKVVWKVDRPQIPNYTPPIVQEIDGREQLVISGCEKVISLDPMTGKLLWEAKGSTQETVTSPVSDGKRVFISGGWPKNHVHAVEGNGSGKVVWRNISRVYVPSMLVAKGFLYAVMDGGSAMCWDCETGQRKWKGVLGGTFSSSPVLVGDDIHVINENGEYFKFSADPDKFKITHKAEIGDQVFATPVFCGGRVYARVAVFEGDERREKLLCLGEPPKR